MNRSLRNDRAVGRQGNMGREIGIMKTPYRTFRRIGDWTRIWGLSDNRAFLTADQHLDESNNITVMIRDDRVSAESDLVTRRLY
jgi:hypothetical protein